MSTDLKNKFNVSGEEKRSLNRIKVGPSLEFNAKIGLDNSTIACAIEDFHFEGVKLLLPTMPETVGMTSDIEFLELYYGSTLISRIEKPKVIRFQAGSHLTLQFESSLDSRGLRGKDRLQIKPTFKPILMAKDPVKINSIITFNLINFNSTGMSVETSLSNKHLVVGSRLKDVTLILPCVGIITLEMKIMYTKRREKVIQMGMAFVGIKEDDIQALARFAIFGSPPTTDGKIGSKFDQVKDNIGALKKLESSLRIETVSTAKDYYSILQIRYQAYKEADKIDGMSSVEDMADKYDEHSIIIMGKIDNVAVATFRLVECRTKKDKFPFEEYLPFSVLDKPENRKKYFEVSRLAIDPKFQGTDILVRLFRENARQTGINKKTNICLSTRALRKNYFNLGFKLVSKEFPHPILKGEFLALLYVDPDRFLSGKDMSVKAYDLVVKDVVDNLAFGGILPKPSPNISRFFLRKIENLILKMSKQFKKK